MKINRSVQSPNFDQEKINLEFIVIHYTACSLESTFEIFKDPQRKVSSHIVLAEDGEIFEVIPCWESEILKAWHAGKSEYNDGTKTWEAFNNFSLGIEIVNLNGNFFSFTEAQYKALISIINHFKNKYKNLENPERIIGHEQIAGKRGKVDPGWKFDWNRLYTACYPGMTYPQRPPNLPKDLLEVTQKFTDCVPEEEKARLKFWQAMSSTLETAAKLSHEK